MKTKLYSLCLSLLLLCPLFAGCQRKGNADIHIFYYTYSDTYISSVRASLGGKLSAAELSYQDYDANGNQTTQTEQIRTAITKGAKVLLVNIVNTGSDDAANEIVELARGAGAALIFFNREVSDSVIKSYEKCAYVGTRAVEAGILQGEMIGEYLVQNFDAVDLNKDGRISYILFKAIYRTQCSVEGANAYLQKAQKPALSFYDKSNTNGYLVDQNGQWSAAAANDYMTTALSSYNTASNNMIELVICNNDSMAEGAISALNVAGYNLGKDNIFIPVFGVDATDAAKSLIKDGKMAGTVAQDAKGMAAALTLLAENALDGERALMDGTDDLSVDEKVRKIRIHYAKYLG